MTEKVKVLMQESESVDIESENVVALTSVTSFQTLHRCCPRGLAPSHSSQRGFRRQNSWKQHFTSRR